VTEIIFPAKLARFSFYDLAVYPNLLFDRCGTFLDGKFNLLNYILNGVAEKNLNIVVNPEP